MKTLREAAWARLARDLDRGKLAAATTDIGLDDVIGAAHDIIDGRIRGRVIVNIA